LVNWLGVLTDRVCHDRRVGITPKEAAREAADEAAREAAHEAAEEAANEACDEAYDEAYDENIYMTVANISGAAP
jgi:hypothetical protein